MRDLFGLNAEVRECICIERKRVIEGTTEQTDRKIKKKGARATSEEVEEDLTLPQTPPSTVLPER